MEGEQEVTATPDRAAPGSRSPGAARTTPDRADEGHARSGQTPATDATPGGPAAGTRGLPGQETSPGSPLGSTGSPRPKRRNASKAKGTAAESAVVAYLREQGFVQAERRALRGTHDRGDIAGVIGTVIEVKNHARIELADWITQAKREAANDNADYGVVWHKRRGYSNPAGWFVTMDGFTFVELLRDALGIEPPEVTP